MITYRDGKPFYADPFNPDRLVPVRVSKAPAYFSGRPRFEINSTPSRLITELNWSREQTTKFSISGRDNTNRVVVVVICNTKLKGNPKKDIPPVYEYFGGFTTPPKAHTWARMMGLKDYTLEITSPQGRTSEGNGT